MWFYSTEIMLSSDQGLLDLTETFWDWKLRQFPEFATRDEFHDHDDQLEAYSLNAYTYRKVQSQHICGRLANNTFVAVLPTPLLHCKDTLVLGWKFKI